KQRSHRTAPDSLGPAGVRGFGYPSRGGGLRLPAALRRRHALLRLVPRSGAAPATAARGGPAPPPPARGVAVGLLQQAKVGEPLGGDARGGPHQTAVCR